jgi:crotonobetainyl-CoA:carnitine CoA-transferase CaiB-like acyl-CoA transferase
MQGFGGIMSVVGEEGRPPVRVGPSIIDCGTALWAVIGILAALYRRRDTGKGGVVDVSLFETAASWMNLHAAQFLASGELPRRDGSGRAGIVPYRAYRTADGDLVVAAANDALYRKLCGALGHPEWAEDPRFLTNPERVVNADALYALIEAEMAKRASADWIAVLDAAGVPCAPVQNVEEMLDHAQTRALGLLQRIPGLSVPLVGLPISFDGARPAPRSGPPALGEATAEMLGGAAPRSRRARSDTTRGV